METHNLKEFLRLDASGMKALNLMPGPSDGEIFLPLSKKKA